MKKLKVGFIGSGFIAHFQLKAMAQIRNMEFVGCLERSGSADLLKLGQTLGFMEARTFKTIADLCQSSDAIAIYVPNYCTLEVMEEVALAKTKGAAFIGVMCEKPLGRNLKEARRFVKLASDAGLRTAYFENQIHMKTIQAQLQQLKVLQEKMGPVALTRCSEEHGGPHMPWFWDGTRQGGGVLLDMGCHSIAVGWYTLTPTGKPLDFLKPISVTCDIGLLKWGQKKWRQQLLQDHGVDYLKTPSEDFATGVVTFQNPETGQLVKTQFTDSWMFEKQGLRLFMDGMGPGYAFEINTLVSPLQIFIADSAGEATADQELALEKSTSSRGLLAVQPNEADLYGYTDENQDAASAFLSGKDAKLNFAYGAEITRLVMAAYMSAETGRTVDLTDSTTLAELETFIPLVQKGQGRKIKSLAVQE
ncbi:MAG: Gfo/Idh/MocA family oxidoreductase [Bdellovibrionales bacterium]|nr:Gfo/Idh/MocA family oxidoreductase [Bdellovibrionales bacterium]